MNNVLYPRVIRINNRIILLLTEELEKLPDNEETAAYAELLENRIYKTMNIKERILNAVESVENELYKKVLVEHYIKGKTLEKTAKKLNYSVKHIYRIQNKALKAFNERFYNECEKKETKTNP